MCYLLMPPALRKSAIQAEKLCFSALVTGNLCKYPATSSGALPALFLAFKSIPGTFSNNSTTAACPFAAALWSGVKRGKEKIQS